MLSSHFILGVFIMYLHIKRVQCVDVVLQITCAPIEVGSTV